MEIPDKLTVNGKEYVIRSLLGKGKGGYSYLAADDAGNEYVLKQLHHEPCEYYQFGDKFQSELRDYARLKQIGIPMPELLDADREQERILKAYIRGETVAILVAENRMEPDYYRQIEAMCARLYPANTNIDYYPTNFVVQDGKLYYVDFECNDYMQQWDYEHWGRQYWYAKAE